MAARLLIIAYLISSVHCRLPDYHIQLQKRLHTLNKPPVKTIITKETREVFDCVLIHHQPAFHHPLLKNHQIQLRPTFSTIFIKSPSKKLRGTREACPDGTVPIKRTTKEDLIQSDKELLARKDQQAPSKRANMRLENHGKLLGSECNMAVYNLSIANDQESSTEVGLEAGPLGLTDALIVGWKVSNGLNGDGFTRLFGFWHDGTNNRGCYNTLCPGFVQIDKEVPINYLFEEASVHGDFTQQYSLFLRVAKDKDSGHWWLIAGSDRVSIGYWPKELFPNLVNGADLISWGGATSPGTNGDYPPMGGGYFPDEIYEDSCFFDGVSYVNSANELLVPKQSDTRINVESPVCYGLEIGSGDKFLGISGFWFMFGGPGGKC